MEKVRPGTGRETGLGHVRSDQARYDVVFLNIQTPATVNRQHLSCYVGRIQTKISNS